MDTYIKYTVTIVLFMLIPKVYTYRILNVIHIKNTHYLNTCFFFLLFFFFYCFFFIYFQPTEVFHVHIEVDPCQFIVYDRNLDGELTREEVMSVFVNAELGEKLFNNLDAIESKF